MTDQSTDELRKLLAQRGLAVVPLKLTQAMSDVIDNDGWAWPDLLAAAEAITEVEYNQLSGPPDERSASDYAIEHGEYLARSAEHMIEKVNTLAEAELRREDSDDDSDSDVDDARGDVTEALGSLRNAIYGFRTRAKRAMDPREAQSALIHKLSGRTADELWMQTGALRAQIADLKVKLKDQALPDEPFAWWLTGGTDVYLASEFTPSSEQNQNGEWTPLDKRVISL